MSPDLHGSVNLGPLLALGVGRAESNPDENLVSGVDRPHRLLPHRQEPHLAAADSGPARARSGVLMAGSLPADHLHA